MGSPLGPPLANVFMSSMEEKLESEGNLPVFYRRYVDLHPHCNPTYLQLRISLTPSTRPIDSAVSFMMETEKDGMLPFLGKELLNRAPQIETKLYVKPTNTGLLLHYHSHVDNRYKQSLLTTML